MSLDTDLKRAFHSLAPEVNTKGAFQEISRRKRRHRRVRRVSTVALAAAVLGGSVAVTYAVSGIFGEKEAKPVVLPPGPGRLAFTRVLRLDQVGEGSSAIESSIHAVDAEGTVTRITRGFSAAEPAWSPDGDSLLYTVDLIDYAGHVDVLDLETGRSRPLLQDPSEKSVPVEWTTGYVDATPSPDGQHTAFVHDEKGFGLETDIYVTDATGSEIRNLTDSPGADAMPAWSPDGERVAFVSDRTGSLDLFVMNADGSGQVQLTSGDADEAYPTWSPDGSSIAFARARGPMSDRLRASHDFALATGGGDASIAPNGTLYYSDAEGLYGRADLFSISVDGTGERRLTHGPADDFQPVWSPDGSQIAFVSTRDADETEPHNTEVYTLDIQTGDVTRLTFYPGDDRDPAWYPVTPSDAPIAVGAYSFAEKTSSIHLFSQSGAGLQLTTQLWNSVPRWAPDGQTIAYLHHDSNRDQTGDIYLARPDGSDLGPIAQDATAFDWSTDSETIAVLSRDPDSEGGNEQELLLIDTRSGRVRLRQRLESGLSAPAWAPDGSVIALTRDLPVIGIFSDCDTRIAGADAPEGIFLFNTLDGSFTRLTSKGCDHPFGWSNDGSRLLFTRSDGIYTVDREGHETRLTGCEKVGPLGFCGQSDRSPSWSPDGSRIAYVQRLSDQEAYLWVMSSDGEEARRVTPTSSDGVFDWSPDGSRIAFVDYTYPGPGAQLCVVVLDSSERNCLTDTHELDVRQIDWAPN